MQLYDIQPNIHIKEHQFRYELIVKLVMYVSQWANNLARFASVNQTDDTG